MGIDTSVNGWMDELGEDEECYWCGHELRHHRPEEWHCIARGHGETRCRCWAFAQWPVERPGLRQRIELEELSGDCAECSGGDAV